MSDASHPGPRSVAGSDDRSGSDPGQLMPARPLYFGRDRRALFGMLQTGVATGEPRRAVLLCRPFGREAIRAQRTYRVLSERLARGGHWVLRFDYYGSGDSDGEDVDLTLQGMCEDIEVASRMLLGEVGTNVPMTWLGLGLGASAAWLTGAKAAFPPEQVVVWDPVLDGRSYLDALRRRHDLVARGAHSSAPGRTAAETADLEVLGFSISPILRREIEGLSCADWPFLPPATRATLVTQPGDGRARSFVANRSDAAAPDLVEQSHNVDWLTETDDAGTVVPGAAIIKLAAVVGRPA
jgi:hypothetical protein